MEVPKSAAGAVAEESVLERIFVNMPWSQLPQYGSMVLEMGVNVELGFGAEDLDSVSLDDVAAAVSKLREAGCRMTAHGPFWDLCPGSTDSEIRRVSRLRISRLFEVLEKIRPEQVVCHTGFDPRHHRGQVKGFIERSIEFWGQAGEFAEKLGVPIALENVWEEDPRLHVEILEKLGSEWLGFCLDTGHQNAFSKTSLDRWLDAVADHLKEIHLHDNDGSYDYHLPVGHGNIDFDYLFGFLNDRGLRPVLTLEPHRRDHLFQSLAALSGMESFSKIL